MKTIAAALLLATSIVVPAAAQTQAPPPPPAAPAAPPKLIVAISVDQFSADLFAQYRSRYTEGFRRLLDGAVFPSGYQSHAATETCPGHSTILTGMRPARTGIVANTWVDQKAPRADKLVYCAEDETQPGTNHSSFYVVSDQHLEVPTLGELMKAANPKARIVSVAGKDRAAVMMGGHRGALDQIWWWQDQKDRPEKAFVSYPGRPSPKSVARVNAAVAALIARGQEPLALPAFCNAVAAPVAVGGMTLGDTRFARKPGDAASFKASPASDGAVLAIAAGLVEELGLGKGPATDLIAVGVSATDYIGHAYGTQGSEMCIQMAELDKSLGGFFAELDRTGVDYEVVLTADHGAHDMTERQQIHAMPMETRVLPEVSVKAVGAAIGTALGIPGPVLVAAEGDIYIAPEVPAARRAAVTVEAVKRFAAFPQVQAVFPRAAIAATPMPTTPPETWTLLERARASFNAGRSGDMLLVLKPRVTAIASPGPGYVETHGSIWDYDRRVPILFWRKGMHGFEQPLSVETVDIAPTLAATIGLKVSGMDGRCLDLDASAGDSCAAR